MAPNYYPESGAGAKRVTAIAQHCEKQGWRVKVITLLPHHPHNQIYAGYDGPSLESQIENGVEVIRIRPRLLSRTNIGLRLWSELIFSIQAATGVLSHNTDVILASSPYMFLGPAGLLLSRLKRVKFVWDVRDLTWLYPRASGKRTYGLDSLFEQLMLAVASRSDALTTATDGLLRYFTRRPKYSISVPNGVSDEVLDSLLALPPPSGPPHVLYAGLLGYNHGLGTLIDAASKCPDAVFTVAGDGPDRKRLEQLARLRGTRNIVFTGHLAQDQLREAYLQATVLVSHVRRHRLFEWTQPAKLWEYMATARPVVHAGEGEAVAIIKENSIGVTVPPDDPDALARAISDLIASPDTAGTLACRARRFVSAHRRRSVLLRELDGLLDALVQPPHENSVDLSRPFV